MVQRRRKKPKRCEAGSGSDSFIIENEAPSAPRFSVIFSAGVPVSTCNKLKVSVFVDSVVPGLNSKIAHNTRKKRNCCATTASASTMLLLQMSSCAIAARAHVSRGIQGLAGVICDAGPELSLEEMTNILRADVEILRVRCFGNSSTACVDFAGKKLPTHAETGLVRCSVRAYEA